MIRLINVSKTFVTKKGKVEALKNVSLELKKGEIFGVIGHSGAGKSTLIRCINLLERPTSGTVLWNGVDLMSLSSKQLRDARRKIGMIFQGFHLLKTATVYENIAIPLKLSGVPRGNIEERVEKYLDVVGLEEKRDDYPSQLSGGQKQRVAIARALAHEPEVLLCDEATSALDPETTDAILELLLKINEEFGITILLITHEMNVIRKICDRVAVMEKGQIVETGPVLKIFTSPVHETTKKFVNSLFHVQLPQAPSHRRYETGRLVSLFVPSSVGETVLTQVSKRFDVFPHLLSGGILHLKKGTLGRWVVHFTGDEEEIEQAMLFLQNQGVRIEGVNLHADFNRRIS
ncbi:methionine ABC transporter ATP-binding protein [Planifilum fimeticola]